VQSFADSLPPPSWTLLAILALLLVVFLAGWRWDRGRTARASRRRNRLARRAESAAEELLRSLGYVVVERQARASWTLAVDGELLRVSSRVDLLVEREGRLFLADVKSGVEAPSPTAPATRRQLLEYQLAFAVDGVLLVDMASDRVLHVDFADLLRRV
jgi:hypothetical protein